MGPCNSTARSQVTLSDLKWLCFTADCSAVDRDTWGPQAEWGEHEMDYILFIRAPAGGVTLKPNPEEVDEVR